MPWWEAHKTGLHFEKFNKKGLTSCPRDNYGTMLKPDFHPPDCKACLFNMQERRVWVKFLDENLYAVRIMPSRSPMTSTFFIKKDKMQ